MGNGGDEDRTFQVDFSAEGFSKLRDVVKIKLEEFLGDYTDDTLAEYVIVLLRNGRRKEEANKELSVFLEDDSVPFVSWLWDHLSSNIHLYLPPSEESMDWQNDLSSDLDEKLESSQTVAQGTSGLKTDLENGSKVSIKEPSSRRRREWRGVVQDEINAFTQISSIDNHSEGPFQKKNDSKGITHRRRSPIRRSRSPRHGKRRKPDEPREAKDLGTKPVLAVPTRLLQFAMRDAVKTSQQLSSRCESISTSDLASRRLRSVVSTSQNSSTEELRPKTRPTLSSVVITSEAATEVSKPRSSGGVFSRLGSAFDHSIRRDSDHKPSLDSRDESEGDDHDEELIVVKNVSRSVSSLEDDEELLENFHDSSVISSSMVTQGRKEDAADTVKKDQQALAAGGFSTNTKILDTSVHGDARTLLSNRLQKEPSFVPPSSMQQMEMENENLAEMFPAGSATFSKNIEESNRVDDQKGTQKPIIATTGSHTTTHPSEDAESRTIFVSNVHFGATKDSLLRHFNKFGDVLKVIIITDPGSGQPTGSAYVEFLKKESAELALSVNGTSFMSRILKVVMKSSSAHQEATASSSWSQGGTWGQQSYPGRGGRYSFSRGAIAGPYRGRLAIKPGARSFQWKRDSPSSSSPAADPGKILFSPTGRSLTYVRSKPDPASA